MTPLMISAGLELVRYIASEKEEVNVAKVKEVLEAVPLEDDRPFWKRKTFWSMSIGVLVPILNKILGWNMDVAEITATISPLLLFIASEQWRKK